MAQLKIQFLIAIDTGGNDDDEEIIKIPKNLIKFVKKYKDELCVKVLIFHQTRFQPTDIISSEEIEQLSKNLEFVNSRSILLFNLGYYIGQGVHILFYSSSQDGYCSWIKDKLDLEQEIDNQDFTFKKGEIQILK